MQIINNDARLLLDGASASSLQAGDRLTLLVKAGLASVKPLPGKEPMILQRLAQDQRVGLTYRGGRFDALSLEAVVPRRVARDQASVVTVSARGLPANLALVHLYVGDQAVQIESAVRESETAPVVLTVSVPPLPRVGQYNLTLATMRDGVVQQTVMEGALLVDAPVRLDRLTPSWGPVGGDTSVTLYGDGFEPGNSVMDGLKVRFGGMPVGRIEVLSSNRMRVTSPRGAPGRVEVLAEDRYGNQSRLNGDKSFGYGLRKLSALHPALIFPSDLWIDQQTGVALTNGGYMVEGYGRMALPIGGWIPENYRAAAFSVQNPSQPQLVGARRRCPAIRAGST